MAFDIESWTGDFLSSQQFLFLDAEVKEHAAGLLEAFGSACRMGGVAAPEQMTIVTLEGMLTNHMAQLDIPLQVRRLIPALLIEFFGYLSSSGLAPCASAWIPWVNTLDASYQQRFREDGTVRGETHKKKYTDVNRNDPCPCGSGKKFKKCCMRLIE